MTNRSFLLLIVLLPIAAFTQSTIPPIGQWREHLNYQGAIQVVKGDKIYCATTNNVFSVDSDGEIEKYSKVTGMNDFGVQAIGWDATTNQLVTVYTNSNIDLIGKKAAIKNIGDVKRSGIAGNKTIYQVYCNNGFAYLSSGLGVIVADLNKYEIKDTWFIGGNGAQVAVNGFTSDGLVFFAATAEGLKSASVGSANLSDYHNWQTLSGSKGLPPGSVQNILIANKQPIVQKKDSLYISDGNNWRLLYTDANWPIVNATVAENKILVCQRTAQGSARVVTLNTTGVIEKITTQSGVISLPRSAITDNGSLWVADQFGGLSKFSSTIERFVPNGPPGTADGELIAANGSVYATAGSVNSSWNYQYNRNGVYTFQEDKWTSQGYYTTPLLDSVLDFITVAVDPANAQSIWAGSYGGGLVNFVQGSAPVIYKKNNSSLQAALGDPLSYRVSGLAFDQNNFLWISNYGAAQDLQVRKTDGSWKAFTIPFTHLENAVSQIVVDDINQLWIVSPKDNGLFCFNYNQTVDNTADDHWKFYRQGAALGNLPSNTVLSIAKDKSGFIWVGTDRGIGIVRCISDVFSAGSCDAILPVVQSDQFAGYLFSKESVQCIAVDGANRKWVGTKNGVWLLSPDGDKIIYRFTAENSPLLGNDVNHITIDGSSGEVFIATSNGICSFRSTATAAQQETGKVLVFPNPVPPGYNGTIAIRGLTDNALVKITELNGRLIYQTRSLGGQAIWDGKTYKGDLVASGVYLVIVRNDDNTENLVTKIVMVR